MGPSKFDPLFSVWLESLSMLSNLLCIIFHTSQTRAIKGELPPNGDKKTSEELWDPQFQPLQQHSDYGDWCRCSLTFAVSPMHIFIDFFFSPDVDKIHLKARLTNVLRRLLDIGWSIQTSNITHPLFVYHPTDSSRQGRVLARKCTFESVQAWISLAHLRS